MLIENKINHLPLYFLFVILFLAGCNSSVFKSEIPYLIGVKNVLIQDSKTDEEWGGFRGKGYSIETYKLNVSAAKEFKKRMPKTLPPKKNNEAWDKCDWSESTFDTSYNEVLSVAFDYGGKSAIEEQSNQIKSLLHKQGVYYAFYYKPNKDNPRNVQFFVFDTNTAMIYMIESDI